ncbi:unnamed protein product [Diatraea saccharalis]|uniref:Uncharacterized protein n=1 Tax=Diatraea saccharalis TaxID=40085 RepID=A0A9N9WKP5_9NEOP|nr:unnamed protein product [Diatraea saccharalis]
MVTESQTPELDPEILSALGEPNNDIPLFGPPIHGNLAQRWGSILKKGITKEVKDIYSNSLLKSYLIPENCLLLHAPKLNAEISAAITDMARNRDKKMESSQQQLGCGITAINKGLSLLLTGDDKIQTIKLLSDGCRILTDLHYMNSQARSRLLTPVLDKSFLNIIRDTERDDTLFGSKLSEKIKASKVIERQGLQIKKTVMAPKIIQPIQSTVTRPRYQENWAGPSRHPYPSNRGGRGGPKKPNFANRRPPVPPQNRSAHPSKPRAAQQ